ncbi:MAG: 4-(cytidine 5'-diphospho)-2-C-methyl-D-erythritol kinase [Candidatus Eisenbacteria bacterium]|nr:4-(cytidine 5'-diphospho)-2-C-methyl-D-erythritol kinase [Candidatus Eisenbacteria bacterium]
MSPLPAVRVTSPAKLNLGLEILGRRPDGYHSLVTVFQAISLADRVDLALEPHPGIRLQVVPSTLDLGPPGENLAVRAAQLLMADLTRPPGLRIRLRKQIPAGAGLGGGSSNAAATLAGLAFLLDRSLSPEQLEDLGSRLGSDVAFFVRGGCQVGVGRGELLRPVTAPPDFWAVLVLPDIHLSTREVYGRLNLALTDPGPLASLAPGSLTRDGSVGQVSNRRSGDGRAGDGEAGDGQAGDGPAWDRPAGDRPAGDWRAGDWRAGDWPVGRPLMIPPDLWGRLHNDLEPVVLGLRPDLRGILESMKRFGARSARVTGSGSALFAVVDHREQGRRLLGRLTRQGIRARLVRTEPGGCRIEPDVAR